MQWISVKDRLPEDDLYVLVYFGKKPWLNFWTTDNRAIGCRNNAENRDISEWCVYKDTPTHDEVTHWMPLPQPPKLCQCGETLHISKGNEPYTPEHWICPQCDSTYVREEE